MAFNSVLLKKRRGDRRAHSLFSEVGKKLVHRARGSLEGRQKGRDGLLGEPQFVAFRKKVKPGFTVGRLGRQGQGVGGNGFRPGQKSFLGGLEDKDCRAVAVCFKEGFRVELLRALSLCNPEDPFPSEERPFPDAGKEAVLGGLIATEGLDGGSRLFWGNPQKIQKVAPNPKRKERVSQGNAQNGGRKCLGLQELKAGMNQGAPPGAGPGTAEPLGRTVPGVMGEAPT